MNEMSIEELGPLIMRRGKKVLEKFNEVVDIGISDPRLRSILQFVKEYWKDNFRPALASFSCEAVGGNEDAANDAVLMATLISAGGGVHDDIIDKSQNKHFRMTVLGQYGLDYSLLAGDLLIVKGWAMACDLAKNYPDKLLKTIEIFGKWTTDVCEAEFKEVSCIKNLDTELLEYQQILRQSMADTSACAALGAIMGNGSENQVQALSEYGSDIGFLFRLSNDLNDVINTEGNLKLRLENESVPLPILYAAKASKENYGKTQNILNKKSLSTQDLLALLDLCIQSRSFDYILLQARENKENASKKLSELEDSNAKAALSLILDKAFTDISKVIS